ncbi:MAG: saccharopine dehydrogenase [Chloroflexi bacterium]|nr:saccharopine dehydrogenase [Chloroflexota bacterium]
MLLIYGATGYTGGLIARIAIEQGLRPVLAGRNEQKLRSLAAQWNVDYRAFPLDAPQLDGITVLLNCAGPFQMSSRLLVEACLVNGVHYTDITGEVDEIEIVRAYDADAQAAGLMLMPGVGFGIVPTDCLARHVATQVPDATHLVLGFETVGGVSQGTLGTLVSNLHTDGYLRQSGRLVNAKPGQKKRRIDFGDGEKAAILNPWRGDLVTAYYSTGIENIETYAAFPGALQFLMRARWLHGLWGSAPFQRILRWLFKRLPAGPSAKELSEGHTHIWAQASNDQTRIAARLHGPEAYRFTGLTASAVATRILAGQFESGFQTPARVYDADLVLSLPGVRREPA